MDLSEQIVQSAIMEAMGNSSKWEDLMDKSSSELRVDLDNVRREKDAAIQRQEYVLAAELRDAELKLLDGISEAESPSFGEPDESGIKPVPEGRFDTDANQYRRECLWRELMAEYHIDEYYVDYDALCRPCIVYPLYREDEVCAADYMAQFDTSDLKPVDNYFLSKDEGEQCGEKRRNVWAETRDWIWSMSPKELADFKAASAETLGELRKLEQSGTGDIRGMILDMSLKELSEFKTVVAETLGEITLRELRQRRNHRPWAELRDEVFARMTPEERAAFDANVREMREEVERHERIMERRRRHPLLKRYPKGRKYRRVMCKTSEVKPRTEYYRDEVEFDEWSRAYETATGRRLPEGSFRLIDRED